MKQKIAALAAEHGIALTDAQAQQLSEFGRIMLEKNQVMNLTAITQPDAVAQLHFLDCLYLTKAVDFAGKRVIDVGCGAGFPGVPLKIAVPQMQLTLLDSLGKRVLWLQNEALPQVGAEAECVVGRAEEIALQRRGQYDIAVSRAVARLNVLSELCLPFVKVGGLFVTMKGAMARQELDEAQKAITTLGGKVERIFDYPIADATHTAVLIRKGKLTPKPYPRRYAKIKQQPL